jgi:hypothetical protein
MKYFFIIASQQFLLTEEPLEEILRERIEYYRRKKMPIDFWLLPSPKFLDIPQLKDVKTKCPEKCVAIISTNQILITWLKLRLQNVMLGEFQGPTNELLNPLEYSL